MAYAILYQQANGIQNGNSGYTLHVIREEPQKFISRSGIGTRVKGLIELPEAVNPQTYLENKLDQHGLKGGRVLADKRSGLVDLLPIDAATIERFMKQEGFQRVTQ